MVDICYPDGADWTCAYSAEELTQMRSDPTTLARMERSEALAWSTLSALTGYRVSLCPTVVRPCAARCNPQTYYAAPAPGGGGTVVPGSPGPYMSGGSWYNGCGCSSPTDCSCSYVPEVFLPTEASGIASVMINGATIDPSAYRVDDGNRLVRIDGGTWPLCQNMANPSDATYEPVVVTGPGGTATFTREGQIVTVKVVTSGVPASQTDGVTPWPAIGPAVSVAPGNAQLQVSVIVPDTVVLQNGTAPFAQEWETSYTTNAPADPADYSNTFEVAYYTGVGPNDLLRYGAGVLAAEFFKACSGSKCRLPQGVTSVTRNGITMEIPSGLFPGGATGIHEVDTIIRIYNPFSLKAGARVLSPDSPRGRIVTGA